MLKMNSERASELLYTILRKNVKNIYGHWKVRMVELLYYVIENECGPYTGYESEINKWLDKNRAQINMEEGDHKINWKAKAWYVFIGFMIAFFTFVVIGIMGGVIPNNILAMSF